MRPKPPQRWAPQGLRPVAKRVPSVQRRRAWTWSQFARYASPLRSSPRGAPRDSKSGFTRVCDALCVAGTPLRGPRAADQVSRSRVSLRSPGTRSRGFPLEFTPAKAGAGMNGVRGGRLRSAARSTAAQTHSRTGISQPRGVGSTNGKPPGGDPAAPVRRRSCRGAGSATAGARLGMW